MPVAAARLGIRVSSQLAQAGFTVLSFLAVLELGEVAIPLVLLRLMLAVYGTAYAGWMTKQKEF